MGSSFSSEAGEAWTSCGKFASAVYIVCSVISILILCIIGAIMYKKKDNSIYTNATISDLNCKNEVIYSGKRSHNQTTCTFKVTYTVNGKEYTGSLVSTDELHSNGEVIQISYDATNPNVIQYKHMMNKTAALWTFSCGGCLIVLAILHAILMKKSKWYNRIMCVNMLSNATSSIVDF